MNQFKECRNIGLPSTVSTDFLLKINHGINALSSQIRLLQEELYPVAKKYSTRSAIILKMLKAKEYVTVHYKEQILLDQLAQYVGISKFQLSKHFKCCFQCSPQQMQSRLRMNTAKTLLETTRDPISQIALDLGYCDIAAFSKAFKGHYGVAPKFFKN